MNGKRRFDICFSLVAIIILLPVYLVIGLAIKLTSRGPVIFRQKRMGYNQRPFIIYKFRTMADNSGKNGVDLVSKTDPRITLMGKLLRRSRLDEIPQFWNVLQGHMSVVGPRPYEFSNAENLLAKQPKAILRFTVHPGITGLAQINGRKGKHIEDMVADTKHDAEYTANQSLAMDLKICLKTLPVMLKARGI